MRPLYATDSKEQLRKACEWLARFARTRRTISWADKRLWLALAGTLALVLALHRPQQTAPVGGSKSEAAKSAAKSEAASEMARVVSVPVRRAELVPPPRAQLVAAPGYRLATMPYGETLMTRYLGQLPNQEALPMRGNRIGDSYNVGPYHFVWVNPGGVAQWIDPVQ